GTFVLLKQCAHNIQLEMVRQLPGCVTLLLNFGPGFALNPDTMTLAIDEQGNIRGANQIASQVLGLDLELSGQVPFEQLFENPIRDLMKLEQEGCQLRLPNGVSLFGQVLSDAEPSARQASTVPSARQTHAETSQPSKSSAQKTNTEQTCIQFGDDSVNQSLSKAARVIGRLPVLLQGESGSGKEVAAKSLHLMSASATGPLVSLNCAAIPEHLIESELFGYEAGAFTGASKQGYEGKFRQAHGGTLFLDEIGDMPPGLQSRLLRVLETREVVPLGGRQAHPVEFQLVCATHKDLRAMVDRGEFRLDLFYRIQGFNVTLPPVRERQDLKQLCQVLLNEICIPGGEPRQLDAELMNWISAYDWPGNVRQLKNALIYADAMAERDALLGLKDLPDEYRQQADVPAAREMASDLTSMEDEAPLQQANIRMIEATLARFDGNVSKAAECLGVARSTIYRKLGTRK
ncbi:MAG: sigma-54-dependent Fis family transcriptional regulator, partial [Oceanobacter sp.]